MIHPHIIHRTGSILKLSPTQVEKLQKDPRSILWINDGLYAIIPKEVVKNGLSEMDLAVRSRELASNGTHSLPHALWFHWSQADEIPAEAGRAIEKYNGSKLDDDQTSDSSE